MVLNNTNSLTFVVMRKKYKKTNSSKYYNGYIDFSNKKDPIIVCDKINHTIKLKSPIINYLHDDFVEFGYTKSWLHLSP